MYSFACHWMKRQHTKNQHVWINFALCTCVSGMLLEPLLVFCVSAPDWAWQLCTISCHTTQLHRQRNKRKHQMLWLNCPSKHFSSHLCHVKLISQWAFLISQMLLLHVSTPSSEDCHRHKAREVVLQRLCLHIVIRGIALTGRPLLLVVVTLRLHSFNLADKNVLTSIVISNIDKAMCKLNKNPFFFLSFFFTLQHRREGACHCLRRGQQTHCSVLKCYNYPGVDFWVHSVCVIILRNMQLQTQVLMEISLMGRLFTAGYGMYWNRGCLKCSD